MKVPPTIFAESAVAIVSTIVEASFDKRDCEHSENNIDSAGNSSKKKKKD